MGDDDLDQQTAIANALRQPVTDQWERIKSLRMPEDKYDVRPQYDANMRISNVVDLPAEEQDKIWEAKMARWRQQAIDDAANEAGLVFDKRVSKGPIRVGPIDYTRR